MEWGWPQWVVVAYLSLRFFNMIVKVKEEKEIGAGVAFVAFGLLGFVIYALHVGGFW